MTPSDYLRGLLDAQRLPPEIAAAARARRDEIAALFTPGPRVYEAGSFAKHTAIAASFDIDVVLYYPHDHPAGPKEIYAAAERRLQAAGHTVVRHGVALRLQYTPGWHVDVVPGRALDDTYEFATLWHSERNSPRKTSLKRHIAHARAAGPDLIRLLKLWRARRHLPIGAFVLELAAARAATGEPSLDTRLKSVFRFLTNLETVRLIDPANSNNVVTEDVPWPNKREVAAEAEKALECRSTGELF